MTLRLLSLAAVAALALTCSCTDRGSSGDVLDAAEEAYACGQKPAARAITDSLVAHTDLNSMSARQLCRLSVLMVHLGDSEADEEERTAMAALTLKAATAADSDTVAAFIETLDNDDRARMVILTAINNAALTAGADEDTTYIFNESEPL